MEARSHNPVEALVIGSGMAGSTVAAELAGTGMDVLTLEAGPRIELKDMVSSQIWARRLNYRPPRLSTIFPARTQPASTWPAPRARRSFAPQAQKEVWVSGRNPEHLLGGTLMGENPDRSVTNSYGQTHEVDNLFLAGASLFPTSAAVNPTATLVSLAPRTTDYIRGNRAGFRP